MGKSQPLPSTRKILTVFSPCIYDKHQQIFSYLCHEHLLDIWWPRNSPRMWNCVIIGRSIGNMWILSLISIEKVAQIIKGAALSEATFVSGVMWRMQLLDIDILFGKLSHCPCLMQHFYKCTTHCYTVVGTHGVHYSAMFQTIHCFLMHLNMGTFLYNEFYGNGI